MRAKPPINMHAAVSMGARSLKFWSEPSSTSIQLCMQAAKSLVSLHSPVTSCVDNAQSTKLQCAGPFVLPYHV